MELENVKKQKIQQTISMKWFYFYTYIRLPFSILLNLVTILGIFLERTYDPMLWIYTICFVYDFFVFFLMLKKKPSAYFFNILLLVFDCLIFSLDVPKSIFSSVDLIFIGVLLLSFLVFNFIWTLPNYLYFKKRKNIFKL